jgi:glycosyltransferase involved in cell wall biosynthesis
MKTICAALIVKNESKVIKRCLDSIKPFIDYWVVCDTGSTDDTKEIISSELSEIPGDLHDVPWVNFGHNRTKLIELCKGKADYLLLIDADEILLVHDKYFKENLILDSYLIKFEGELEWRQKKLVGNHINWRYEGVTHEYITSSEELSFEPTDSISLNHFCDGARRPEKFEDDIRLLRAALKDDPKNARYWFYLAQCLYDLGRYKKALKAYQNRLELGGWEEEVYYSAFKKALCLSKLKSDFPIHELVQAHEFRPSRVEAIYEIIKHYREEGYYDIAYSLCKRQLAKPRSQDILFIDKSIYDYKLIDELAVCAYWVGEYEESFILNRQLLENPYLPAFFKERIEENQKFAESKMQE